MTRFYAVDTHQNRRVKLDFADFVQLVKGCSISSLAAGEDFVEFGLAERLNVRIGFDQGGPYVGLVSTLNDGDLPPFRMEIVSSEEETSAELVELRIRALRQVYAIAYLVDAERTDELASLLSDYPAADIEAALLPDEEKLFIKSAGPGSLWLTLATKSQQAFQVAARTFSLVYKEGRGALLRRVEADTRVKELAAEEKEIEVKLKRAHGILDLYAKVDKLKNPESKQRILAALEAETSLLPPQTMALPLPRTSEEENDRDDGFDFNR